jgi:hypothetical protein
VSKIDKTDLPRWEDPKLAPLGGMATGEGGDNQCRDGAAPPDQCRNGGAARISGCHNGSGPPSGSCGTGFGGTD